VEQHWQANRQAFVLYVLAEAGAGDLDARSPCLIAARCWTPSASLPGHAFGLLQPDEPGRVDTLLSDITSAAIVSATGAHWEEPR